MYSGVFGEKLDCGNDGEGVCGDVLGWSLTVVTMGKACAVTCWGGA